MKQAIVIFLREEKKIQNARNKYQRNYEKYKPHITLAFPFTNINQNSLDKHIKESIKNIKPFALTLSGLKKSSKEYYLYLLVKEGHEKVIKIHKNLYSRLITNQLRKDIPYIPHITLGVFKSKEEIDNAIKELKKENIKFKANVKSIQLLTLNKDDSLKSVKNYSL